MKFFQIFYKSFSNTKNISRVYEVLHSMPLTCKHFLQPLLRLLDARCHEQQKLYDRCRESYLMENFLRDFFLIYVSHMIWLGDEAMMVLVGRTISEKKYFVVVHCQALSVLREKYPPKTNHFRISFDIHKI